MLAPTFSVIIPTYNRAHLIERSLRSVLSQTFVDFELIIVDDGSTDNTKAVVGQIQDRRLRYIYQENKGRSAARNAGVAHSKGCYITFLDSDDEVLPEWLAHFVGSFENAEVGLVGCGIKLMQPTQMKITQVLVPQRSNQCIFLAGAFAMRRELFESTGGYSEELAYSENSELAIRLDSACKQADWRILSIPEVLVIYYSQPRGKARMSQSEVLARLQAARHMLQHHIHCMDKRTYATYCSVVGTNAARLGYNREAIQFLAKAVRSDPRNWHHFGRLLLALLPPLGRKFWLRYH